MFDASLSNPSAILSHRRAILGMTTAARSPETPRPDAGLLELGREWTASAARLDELDQRLEEAQDRYVPHEIPEALFQVSNDHRHCFGADEHFSTGRHWFGRSERIEWLRTLSLTSTAGNPDMSAISRRDAIVSAYDEWMAEENRRCDACGLTAADAAQLEEIEANTALRQRIIELPANTLDGLLVKARVVAWCTGGLHEIELDLADDTDANNRTMSDSISRDLVAMLGSKAAA